MKCVRQLPAVLLGLALLLISTSAGAQDVEEGSIRINGLGIGVGAGFSFGWGTFNVDGRQVPFKLEAYKLLDLGISTLSASGTVEGASDPGDLEGQYTGFEGTLVPLVGPSVLIVRNDAGVTLRLRGFPLGLRAAIAAEGFKLTVGEVPPRPAPPPEPEPEPKPAAPAPAQPPPPPPDPCEEPYTLPALHFEFDSAQLRPGGQALLDPVAARLSECPLEQLLIEGHTDSTGPEEYNMRLSERRAESVRSYLESHGVAASRMSIAGRGPKEPIESNDTKEGRARNRRVVIEPVD